MSVHVVWNTIQDPVRREVLEGAVVGALAARPKEEHWDVRLTESKAVPGWTAVVIAPDKTKVSWSFDGIDGGDSPDVVRRWMETLLRAAGL